MKHAFVRRIALHHYRSVERLALPLSGCSVFIGRTGSGKSVVLDALGFVGDALRTSLSEALRRRGGLDAVRHKTGGAPPHVVVRLEVGLPDGANARYGIRLATKEHGAVEVVREEAELFGLRGGFADARMVRGPEGTLDTSVEAPARLPGDDELWLPAFGAHPDFAGLLSHLAGLRTLDVDDAALRHPQAAEREARVDPDGRNLAAVLARLQRLDPDGARRVLAHLDRAFAGLSHVEAEAIGALDALVFQRERHGKKRALKLPAVAVSRGVLRATAALVAAYAAPLDPLPLPALGLRRAVAGLDDRAARVVLAGLVEASADVQLLVSTSARTLLLDDELPTEHFIGVVRGKDGATGAVPLHDKGRVRFARALEGPTDPALDQLGAALVLDEPDATQLRLFSARDRGAP